MDEISSSCPETESTRTLWACVSVSRSFISDISLKTCSLCLCVYVCVCVCVSVRYVDLCDVSSEPACVERAVWLICGFCLKLYKWPVVIKTCCWTQAWSKSSNKQRNKPMKEQTNKQTKERMSDWTKEQMKEGTIKTSSVVLMLLIFFFSCFSTSECPNKGFILKVLTGSVCARPCGVDSELQLEADDDDVWSHSAQWSRTVDAAGIHRLFVSVSFMRFGLIHWFDFSIME